MPRNEIHRNAVIYSQNGGSLDLLDTRSGEVLYSFAVQPGRHRASYWADLVQPGQHLEVAEGCAVFPARSGVSRTIPGNRLLTAANPDFRPTSATRLERQMRVKVAEMDGLHKKMAAKFKAMESVTLSERIPDAPKEKPVKPENDEANFTPVS